MNSTQPSAVQDHRQVLVWDLPTRIFHWLFALAVLGALTCAAIGGQAMAWHMRFGYTALALVSFRLVWGFVGPRYARFANFPPQPTRALRYLRDGAREPFVGHNPAGALSVYAILACIALQAATGLFASDDLLWSGPLSKLVPNSVVAFITEVHHLNGSLIWLLVITHLGAIAFHTLSRREPLVKAMIDRKSTRLNSSHSSVSRMPSSA